MAEESKQPETNAALLAGLPAAETRAKNGDLAGAIEDLLSIEKKTRAAGDAFATSKVVVLIAKLCYEHNDLAQLNAQILIISKRRGQLKQALSDLVITTMGFLDKIHNKEDRIELITTLRTVTEGKIYVEVERARVTKLLADIKEKEGKINEASDILQEVQVETFGSMEKKEKAEFILEQMRLTLRQRDFIRTGILSNKMNKHVLDEEGFEDIRVKYFSLMALLNHAKHDTVALCKGYMSILKTRGYDKDSNKWKINLENAIIYAALSPYDNEVSDLLHRLHSDKRTEELPSYAALLKLLTTDELIPWPLPSPHHDNLHAHHAFIIDPNTIGTTAPGNELLINTANAADNMVVETSSNIGSSSSSSSSSTSSSSSSFTPISIRPAGALKSNIVLKEDEERSTWWPIFQKRIVQHNIRVISKAYTRITFTRLAQLLHLDAPTTEAMVSELVSSKSIYARMDRPLGIVVFERPRPATEVLSDWGHDLEEVLTLIEKTSHLIQKEYMVHGIA